MTKNKPLTESEALYHLQRLAVQMAEFRYGKECDQTAVTFQSVRASILLRFGKGITIKIKCASRPTLLDYKGLLLREIYKNGDELDFTASDKEAFVVGNNLVIFGSGKGDITLEVK